MKSENAPTMADAKAALAKAGVSVRPDAKLQVLEVDRDGPNTFIVLDRTREDWTPPYCIHGYTQCLTCDHPVYLGDKSVEAVKAGTLPVCTDCAHAYIKPDNARVATVKDHLRADGPHEH